MKNQKKTKGRKRSKKKRPAIDLNLDAIELNIQKFIKGSGLSPGMAEDIIARERESQPKRLFKKEAVYISR